MDRCPAMETDAAAFGGIPSCSFVDQRERLTAAQRIRLQVPATLRLLYFYHRRCRDKHVTAKAGLAHRYNNYRVLNGLDNISQESTLRYSQSQIEVYRKNSAGARLRDPDWGR